MREIKFRVWDGEKMVDNVYPSDYDEVVFFYASLDKNDEYYTSFEFLQNVITKKNIPTSELMQYTGLKDKNGKEIYEGDIVSAKESVFQDKKPLEVKFGFYSDADGISYGWYVKGRFESSIVWEHKTKLQYIKVVGNIYENLELLK